MPDSEAVQKRPGAFTKETARAMALRSAEVRRQKREARAVLGITEPGAKSDRELAIDRLMRIVRDGVDNAAVSAARAVLDLTAEASVDLHATGLEDLTDEQLDARIAALRHELATA